MISKSAKSKQSELPKAAHGSSEQENAFKPVALPALVAAMQANRSPVSHAKQKELPAILRQEALTD
jgi:hypothetical protein